MSALGCERGRAGSEGRGEGRRGGEKGGGEEDCRDGGRETERMRERNSSGERGRDMLYLKRWAVRDPELGRRIREDTEYGDRKQHTEAAGVREDTGAETLGGSAEAVRPKACRTESTRTNGSGRKDP